MKKADDSWLQIASKNTLSAIDHQGKTFNTNISKAQAENVFFWPLDDIELVDWTPENKFARFLYCEDIHYSSILKLAIEMQFRNLQMQIYQASCFNMIQTIKKSVCWACVFTQKGTLLTSFHIHSFVVFYTDLQKNTITTCILTSWNHILSNMQDQLLQLRQLIQYRHVFSLSTVITNEIIGEEFCLSPNSLDGYEAMGFNVTQLTQDEEKSLFTIKTNMPISMLVYGDTFQWTKYGHLILPSNLDLTKQ
jgi:hypothetical protein